MSPAHTQQPEQLLLSPLVVAAPVVLTQQPAFMWRFHGNGKSRFQGCVGRSTKVVRGQEDGWQASHCAGGQEQEGRVRCHACGRGSGSPAGPKGEVFLPWGCFSAVSGILEKSCLVSVPASNSLSIVTLTNNPTEVRAGQGNKTCSVSKLTDPSRAFALLIAAASESEKNKEKPQRGLGCWSCYLVIFLGSFAAACPARM